MILISKPVAELVPAPYNPRKTLATSDDPYRKLSASLERFGLVEPLLWNARTGFLVSGHQRLNILKAQQREKVPVVVIDISPEEEMALNVVLNNRQAQGDWDLDRLQLVMQDLASASEEMAQATGFDAQEARELSGNLEPVEEDWQEEDAMGEVEISFRMPRERFEELRPMFDQLTHDHQVDAHVRLR
jgi:ParB-like chromosome segregation protein Spo0J